MKNQRTPAGFPKPTLIAPYGVKLWVVFAPDISPARRRFDWAFGSYDGENCSGLCAADGSRYGLFFSTKWLSHDVIAHEVFHATHRILEWTETMFTPSVHEPYAYLCGHLTELVYVEARKQKARIRLRFPD
jgi:hypothetical protein